MFSTGDAEMFAQSVLAEWLARFGSGCTSPQEFRAQPRCVNHDAMDKIFGLGLWLACSLFARCVILKNTWTRQFGEWLANKAVAADAVSVACKIFGILGSGSNGAANYYRLAEIIFVVQSVQPAKARLVLFFHFVLFGLSDSETQ